MPYPHDVAAGQRFKIEQAYEFLKNRGHIIKIDSFFNTNTWDVLYEKGHLFQKIFGTIISWIKRIIYIFTINKYDAVYVYMWVTPRGSPISEFIVKKLSRKLIVDIDDLVYKIDGRSFFQNFLSCHLKSYYLVKNADCVIHNSPSSVKECAKINVNNNAIHIPCSFNMDKYQPKSHRDKELVTLGWTGTVSSIKYLKSIEPMLRELYAIKKFKLSLITNFEYEISGLDVDLIFWNAETEIQDLLRFDIGIYPVFFDEWSASKGGLKVQQYMAMGLPSVSTNHGAASHYIEHKKTGFLVKNDDDWIKYLSILINNTELRSTIGSAARKEAKNNFSKNASIQSYYKVICN